MGYQPFGCRFDINHDEEVSLMELHAMINTLNRETQVAPEPFFNFRPEQFLPELVEFPRTISFLCGA